MSPMWDHVRHFFAGPQLPWVILWLGLATLIVGLVVLTRTSWGQSNPLRKCAALSLLVHLLLAAYATTVEIVTAGSPDGMSERGPVSLLLVGDSGVPADQQGAKSDHPWDQVPAGAVAGLDAASLDAAPTPVAAPSAPLDREPLPAVKPLFDKLTAELAPKIAPPSDPIPAPPMPRVEPTAAAAAQIDAPAPPKPEAAAVPRPDTKSPDRQTIAPNEHVAPPSELPNVSAGAKPQTLVPGPDSLVPPADAPGAISAERFTPGGADPTLQSVATGPAPLSTVPEIRPRGGPTTSDGGESHLAIVPVPNGPPPSAAPSASPANGSSNASGHASPLGPAAPDIYQDRTASDRLGVLRRRGGSPETEAAVQAALKWLVHHQSADGHWDAALYGAGREDVVLGQNRNGAGARAHTGVTGLALLALLGSGNTHLEGPYADNVRRGLEYLLRVQGPDGDLGGPAETFAFMYCHGMASFSLSEAYAMTHDRRLEKPLRAAIGYTLAAQHPTTGGWRYQLRETGDTSQLGWQLMALKSAELAGLPMPQQTRDGAVRFLTSVSSGPNGGLASYRPGELPSRPMTAEALVCRQFLGMARDNPSSDEAGDYLLGDLPSKDKINLYYWYYGTLGMYQLQGPHWQKWNAALQAALVGQQATAGDLAGSFDPNGLWGGYGGRVYSTAMSALCLEVYYRFLPIYGDEPLRADAPHPH